MKVTLILNHHNSPPGKLSRWGGYAVAKWNYSDVGKTMVFLKKDVVHTIRQIINNNLKGYRNMCNITSALITKIKKKRVVESNLKNLNLTQAYFRKYKYMKELT
ncbi:myosin B, putative (MyoB) [Plasmodium ovale curtisi]|uniref:Myosin B, putative (MyoB) n=1 Tax=Plasmodium ovale curtisi TaxID=864141 RepID=A0A1A8WM69_PLAOA|nr:myosin B, putative (MyoB) [Plasmodium ovale curtisi]SBS93302.1 myosin B, putative (MyoB) [Plasmodium ovale curtisi]